MLTGRTRPGCSAPGFETGAVILCRLSCTRAPRARVSGITTPSTPISATDASGAGSAGRPSRQCRTGATDRARRGPRLRARTPRRIPTGSVPGSGAQEDSSLASACRAGSPFVSGIGSPRLEDPRVFRPVFELTTHPWQLPRRDAGWRPPADAHSFRDLRCGDVLALGSAPRGARTP